MRLGQRGIAHMGAAQGQVGAGRHHDLVLTLGIHHNAGAACGGIELLQPGQIASGQDQTRHSRLGKGITPNRGRHGDWGAEHAGRVCLVAPFAARRDQIGRTHHRLTRVGKALSAERDVQIDGAKNQEHVGSV